MPDLVVSLPRDHRGRFVPLDCPLCGHGQLVAEIDPVTEELWWYCDGVFHPDRDEDAPFNGCWFSHCEGQPYQPLRLSA